MQDNLVHVCCMLCYTKSVPNHFTQKKEAISKMANFKMHLAILLAARVALLVGTPYAASWRGCDFIVCIVCICVAGQVQRY